MYSVWKKKQNSGEWLKKKQTGEKILYLQMLCIRKPGGRVMKLINKGALVCAARCCAAVPGCPWIFHEAESGEVCCLEHLVESTGTLVARKLQLQEGRREKMPIKMKGGEKRQSASLRIIWLICFANLILRLAAPDSTKQTQWTSWSQQNKYNTISSGSIFSPFDTVFDQMHISGCKTIRGMFAYWKICIQIVKSHYR